MRTKEKLNKEVLIYVNGWTVIQRIMDIMQKASYMSVRDENLNIVLKKLNDVSNHIQDEFKGIL